MKRLLQFIEHPVLLAFSVGVIFGMVGWDLAFEAQRPLDAAALNALYEFYRVLHQGGSPGFFALQLAVVLGFAHLVRRALVTRTLAAFVALGCFLLALVIEVGLAVPAEMELVELGPVAGASQADLDRMREYTVIARNTHYSMWPLLAASVWLSRRTGFDARVETRS